MRKNTVQIITAVVLVLVIGFAFGQLMVTAHKASTDDQNPSAAQQTLDKFVFGESLTISEMRPLIVTGAITVEAVIWCKRHQVPEAEKVETVTKIEKAFRDAIFHLEQPLFPVTYRQY